MDLAYQEKRIWISLSTQFICYLLYFVELHRGAVTIGILFHVILAITVLQIILQSILALTARREPKDERDIAIERIAYRNAYLVLVVIIAICMGWLAVSAFHVHHTHPFGLGAFHVINGLLLLLLLAELAKLASQLVLYRRAA